MSKRERICSFHYDEANRKYGAEPYEIGDELVRCKECKFWKNKHLCATWSAFGTIETDDDDYCSYGEREGE